MTSVVFDDQEDDKQRSGVEPGSPYEEPVPFEVFRYRHELAKQSQDRILLWVDFRIALAKELDAAVNQNRAE